ncbi:hypothetical protein EW146_g2951 [Bondarzewia mesenterica]|uniref:F-box domain-containing protein n=1 Tax=Bondarzewia mesenterica TaxID=1095465 RepID=A0A4S4M0L7_9AGAM|nr:hypothetical protein EW146_g2951 [Bondarzewia mesenterica]
MSFDRYHLSREDILEVHKQIHEHEQAIASVDAKLEELMKEAHRLRITKSRYQDLVSKRKGIITLARLAPDEVLAQIFEHCVAEGWARAPLAVSQVCAKWRRAALTPRVWSHILLTSDSLDPVGRTRFWLSRAAQSPLYITIDVAAVDPHLLSAMDLLLDNLSRWRSLTLNARFVQQARDIVFRCTRSAPNLREISIFTVATAFLSDEEPEELLGLGQAFQNAPCLRGLNVTCNILPSSLPSQISDLDVTLVPFPFGPLTVTTLLGLLANLPRLRRLTLTVSIAFSGVITVPNDGTTETPLTHLESLTINSFPDFNEILRHLRTPILRRLYIRSSEPPLNYPHEETGTSLCHFIDNCSPPLELLELHDIDLPQDHFIRCFLGLPTLQELRLHETEISNQVLAMLNGPAGACPQLRSLDLRWCEQLSGKALVNMVSSRNAELDSVHGETHSHRIDEITVVNCALVEERDVLDLARATVCSVIARNPEDHCRKP